MQSSSCCDGSCLPPKMNHMGVTRLTITTDLMSRLFTVPYFFCEIVDVDRSVRPGRHLDLLMRAKLGREQNALALHHPYSRAFCTLSSSARIKVRDQDSSP